MKAMNKAIFVLALSVICTPALGQPDPQEWTWTGDTNNLWTSANWECDGLGCPNPLTFPDHVNADVIITDSTNAPVVNWVAAEGPSYDIKTLTLNTDALLTIPLGSCASNIACVGLKVFAHDGLTLAAGSKISIEGGYLQLLGGGKLDIHANALIEFAETANGRLILSSEGGTLYRAPLYEIPGGSSNEVIRGSVRGFIDGIGAASPTSIGGGGAETLVLWDREITGSLVIYVRLINNGRVVADELTHWIDLKCQPKGGSGLWKIDHGGAKIVVWVPVTGTAESQIVINDGVLTLADLWVTAGTLHWLGGTIVTDPRTGLFVGEAVSCTE